MATRGCPKALEDVQELARQHVPAAIAELARLAVKAKSETARIAACRELLDRDYACSAMRGEDGERQDQQLDIVNFLTLTT